MPSRAVLFNAVRQRFAAGQGFALATLNLDHIVKMRRSGAFTDAYLAQDFVVADGRPIVWLSRLAGRRVAFLPGSDLVVPLCGLAADCGVPIALIGSTQEVLDKAARALAQRVPGLEIALLHAPSGVFDPDGSEAARILDDIQSSGARLCFLALGAPKQESFAARGRRVTPGVGFASIGAGLDFMSGHQVRAPRWLRALALEWLWRAVRDPGRMVPRYAMCFAILPGLVVSALRLRF